MKLFVLLLTALLAASCAGPSGSGPEKTFPGGDLYEEKEASSDAPERTWEGPEQPDRQPIYLPNRREVNGLVLTANPRENTVTAGEPIVVTLLVRNTTSSDQPVTYNSGKRFDLVLYQTKEQQRPVYLWSEDRMFTQALQEMMISPGSTSSRQLEIPTTTTERASGRASLSDPVPPGTYYLWGTHEGEPMLTHGPIEVVVRARGS